MRKARPATLAACLLLGLCAGLGFTLSLAYSVKATQPSAGHHAHHAHHAHTTPSPNDDGPAPTPHCLACALTHGTTLQPPFFAVQASLIVTSVVLHHAVIPKSSPTQRVRARAPPAREG